MYNITDYSYKQADKLGVYIAPATNKKFKIDIFDRDYQYITSIGSKSYSDYPTYILSHGKEYADERRRLYKLRHSKDRDIEFSRGWFADKILW